MTITRFVFAWGWIKKKIQKVRWIWIPMMLLCLLSGHPLVQQTGSWSVVPLVYAAHLGEGKNKKKR